MNAIQALSDAGGTIRITVFRGYFNSPTLDIIANVAVSCTIIDKAELIPINIFTIKGVLKRFPATQKIFLDFKNSKDPEYPNFWFGSGFTDYVSAYTIKKMVDLIPVNAKGAASRKFVEFRVLEDGTIADVDIQSAYKQKKKQIADSILKVVTANTTEEEVEGEQLEIQKLISIPNDEAVFVE